MSMLCSLDGIVRVKKGGDFILDLSLTVGDEFL